MWELVNRNRAEKIGGTFLCVLSRLGLAIMDLPGAMFCHCGLTGPLSGQVHVLWDASCPLQPRNQAFLVSQTSPSFCF